MRRNCELWSSGTVLALLLLYWMTWCLIAPVTNVDSQVYNLARLWVIDRDGLFGNPSYTWITQLIMPWSFDAVHYPFVRLGYGYALPSFFCLLGIMAVAFGWARERGDTVDGVRACLGLLAMPMVVMQATTTKNDLVTAFCLFCWIEALRRYRRQPTRASVLLAALALAFATGCKLTGLLYAGAAVLVSLWVLRRQPSDIGWFGAGLALMLALNGSWEIYLNNYIQFGDWRGDPLFYRYNSNNDGWRGILANELRYATSLLDLQLLPAESLRRFAILKFDACEYLLGTLRLQGLGLMSLPWRRLSDDRLFALMTMPLASDSTATYGLIGTLLFTALPLALLRRRRFDFPVALFLGGVIAQLLVSVTLGWHPGNHRYFVAAWCLGWAAMSLLITSRHHPRASLAITVLAATGALVVPFRAVQSPQQLAVGLRDRNALLADFARQMIARAQTWKRNGEVPVVLTARRAPVFHLYDQLGTDLISIPELSEDDMMKLDDVHRRGEYPVIAIRTELNLSRVVCEPTLPAYDTRICVWRRDLPPGGGWEGRSIAREERAATAAGEESPEPGSVPPPAAAPWP